MQLSKTFLLKYIHFNAETCTRINNCVIKHTAFQESKCVRSFGWSLDGVDNDCDGDVDEDTCQDGDQCKYRGVLHPYR